MCVNKLYIANNKLDFNPLIDRFYNYVPCGQCEECMSCKSQDYETRAIYEYESSICTFYYTLTYNNEHLPLFNDIPVFSKYDVQCFLKRLRKKGYKFRYFISSEYGGKTLRPHYHILFFFKYHVFSYSFYKDVLASWKNGFIYPGRNLGLVNGVIPCRYVAKYVQKDSYQVAELDRKKLSQDDYKRYLLYKNTYYIHLDILPFHLQSAGLGLSMLDNLSTNDLVNGFVVRNDSFGLSRKVKIPFYIFRKICYEPYINLNGNISFILKDECFDIWKKRLLNSASQLKDKIIGLFDFINSNFSFLKIPSKLFAYEDFKAFACDFVDNEIDSYVSYKLLYSGFNFCPFQFDSLEKDIDRFIDWQRTVPFLPFLPNVDYLPNNCFDRFKSIFYDAITNMLDEANILHCWFEYQKRVNGYNVAQIERSRKTSKLKLVHVKTYNEFINYKQNHICLNILNTKKNRLKCPTLQILQSAS